MQGSTKNSNISIRKINWTCILARLNLLKANTTAP